MENRHSIASWERNKPANIDFQEFIVLGGLVKKAVAHVLGDGGSRQKVVYDGQGRCLLPSRRTELDINFFSNS